MTDGEQRERDGGEHAGAHREHERAAVLLCGRPVLLDTVEAIQRALDLTHQRAAGHECGDADQRQYDVLAGRTGAVGVEDRLGQRLARRTRSRLANRADDRRTQVGVAERGSDTDEHDDTLHKEQRDHERQRPRVAEPVRGPQTHERVAEQPAATGPYQRLAGIVAA